MPTTKRTTVKVGATPQTLGKAVPFTASASVLSEIDIIRARLAWRKHAPKRTRSLLDAKPVSAPVPDAVVKGI